MGLLLSGCLAPPIYGRKSSQVLLCLPLPLATFFYGLTFETPERLVGEDMLDWGTGQGCWVACRSVTEPSFEGQ